MMKRKIYFLAATLFIAGSLLSFTSCSDDDNDRDDGKNAAKEVCDCYNNAGDESNARQACQEKESAAADNAANKGGEYYQGFVAGMLECYGLSVD